MARRTLLSWGGAWCLAGPSVGRPAFPSRPVMLVVPYAAGGSTDTIARYLAHRLSARWNAEVLVTNRSSGDGLAGPGAVAGATADGHTLLFSEGGFSTVAALNPQARGANLSDLTPVAVIGRQPYIIVVHADLPVSTLVEFVAYAKARPDQLRYASGGQGSSTHFTGELFKEVSGTKIRHVAYRGGGPAVLSIAAGENQLGVLAIPSVTPFLKSGRLKALAVTGEQRTAGFPDVPTTTEARMPQLMLVNWIGMFAPKDTPRALVETLNAEFAALVNAPEVRERLESFALTTAPLNVARSADFVRQDIDRWRVLMKRARITTG